ncbi:MAG: 4Fe-4S dicluster domain-containing protein [bacterium]|nr:4Fe-4S dicluster domain-containing protein [bacterium]
MNDAKNKDANNANQDTEHVFDIAEYKKVGFIQQKQKDYFAMRLHAVGGDFTAPQLMAIAEVAYTYGKGQVHLSTRQGVEIHYVHYSKLEAAQEKLAAVGITMGACGPRVRIVSACPGSSTCRWGTIDTKEMARYLDEKYFRSDTPHKFKMAVTGCPHNCAKASENDIGIMGGILPEWSSEDCIDCNLCVNACPTLAIHKEENKKESQYLLDEEKCINCSICTKNCPTDAWKEGRAGYIIWIGGTMGKKPRIATRLTGVIEDKEEVYRLVDRTIEYYRAHGRKKERFGHTIERIGEEKVRKEILYGTE